jgi:hypothetical protein
VHAIATRLELADQSLGGRVIRNRDRNLDVSRESRLDSRGNCKGADDCPPTRQVVQVASKSTKG